MGQSDIEDIIALAERKAKKVAQLIALLRDPDLADIVAALRNGTARPTVTAPVPEPTGVRGAIRALYDTLPERFTGDDILRLLQERGVSFGGRDPKAALRDQLYALVQAREIRVIREGKGGKLNVYERVRP